ncbi:MAG: rod shape-determining protein MreD [Bacteroidales bacterium]|jgi:rod shape-determining protein MreD|nr:rod shape-determining protein MreD [Bacteroidales bacterium]MDD2204034.1 rod shape-determining protein MreD [Bacteroidales bacterium]MDD3151612.1 rod shape-determining protein MreD [Bacteroidales bacterium]MDD3913378.1 rod shape-determining protein MreD [Bacteroidales bacterium]MDD4633173.1 rod shape-determining protein MreD [Bacteroidales bacterium]
MNKIFSHIIRFVALVLLQVLVFNKVLLFEHFNPYLYLVILLMLPVHIKHWLLLVIGFVTGLTVDIFSCSLGIHASACVLACAFRPFIINLFHNEKELKQGIVPELAWFGMSSYIFYTLLFVFIHHIVFYFLSVFTFDNFFRTLFYILVNTLITTLFVIIYQMLFHSRK